MEFIPPNAILKFNTDQLKSVRKRYNLDKPGDMNRAIDVLEAWIKTQTHFTKKDLPRNYLEKAILASKGSLERTKSKLDKVCTLRTVMPNFFGENLTKNVYDDLHVICPIVLPTPTDDNYRVFLMKPTGSTFTSSLFLNCYRYIIVICEYFMIHDYNDGFILVVDYTEANMKEIIKAINITELHQIIKIIIDGFGMRIKGIHLLTSSKFINIIVTIFKALLSHKLGKRICVHKNLSSVYEHVPKDLFPVEYGGKEKSFLELFDDLRLEVTGKAFKNYLDELNKAKIDESRRHTEYLTMPGSLRTLNLD